MIFSSTSQALPPTWRRHFGTGLNQVQLANGTLGQATTGSGHHSFVHSTRRPIGGGARPAGTGNERGDETDGGPPRCHAGGRHPSRSPTAVPSPAVDALAQQVNGGLTDQQIATSYGLEPLYNAGDLGAGQTVDIYELEPFAMSDIATFDECYFGTDNTGNITVTNVDGGPGTGSGSGEAALDVEAVSAHRPGRQDRRLPGPQHEQQLGPARYVEPDRRSPTTPGR